MDQATIIALASTVLTAIATAVGTIGFVYTIMRNLKSDVSAQIGKLDGDIRTLAGKVDVDTRTQNARMDQMSTRMDQMSSRTDQLYEMFIDLLKSQNPKIPLKKKT